MDSHSTPPQASWNENTKQKIQAESNTLRAILRQHSIQVTIIVRCYPQELKLITCFSSEHKRVVLITGLRGN